ncbi:MAG: hypothetical protein ACSLEM_06885 [Candidatus Malihini olakiniferum]
MFCSLLKFTALFSFFTLFISAAPINIFNFSQLKNAPDEIYAMIEIPACQFNFKYEIDADNGFIIADRF